MTDHLPKVSIIIPCWNAEAYIADAIGSCLGQSYQNIEIVVVNDGSTDGSKDIIDGFGDRIIALHLPNGGSNKARNNGFEKSSGEFIKFLDADDFLWPGSIQKQVSHIFDMEDKYLSVGESFAYYESQDQEIRKYPSWPEGETPSKEIARFVLLPPAISNVLYRRNQLSRIGCFDEGIFVRQEVDLFYRCIFSGNIPKLLKEPIFVYRHHDSTGRVSATNLTKAYRSDLKLLSTAVENLKSLENTAEFSDALEALACGIWGMGRLMLRTGFKTEAQEAFLLAKRCNPASHVIGRKPYKILYKFMGPYMSESFLSLLKKACKVQKR